MANIGQKDGIIHVRFHFCGKEFKKSLKTQDEGAATAALHVVSLTIHRLLTGQIQLPAAVDPGDFILSGGRTLLKPKESTPQRKSLPSTKALIEEYKESQMALSNP